MILSIADGVDREAFDASEKKQDEATDEISFAIQRMTALLLKNDKVRFLNESYLI